MNEWMGVIDFVAPRGNIRGTIGGRVAGGALRTGIPPVRFTTVRFTTGCWRFMLRGHTVG